MFAYCLSASAKRCGFSLVKIDACRAGEISLLETGAGLARDKRKRFNIKFQFWTSRMETCGQSFQLDLFDFEISGDFVDFDDFSRLLDFIELKIDFRLRLDFRERSDFDNESWTIFWRKMWILWELLSSYQTRDQVFFRDFLKWRKLQLLQKAQQHQQ